MSVTDALSHFAGFADADGNMSQENFFACFDEIGEPIAPEDHATLSARRSMLQRLFEAFDSNGDGTVDFAELCGGLSILCMGAADVKVESAFLLFGAFFFTS